MGYEIKLVAGQALIVGNGHSYTLGDAQSEDAQVAVTLMQAEAPEWANWWAFLKWAKDAWRDLTDGA